MNSAISLNCNEYDFSVEHICVPNKIEDLNLSEFIMITAGINELKTFTKHISRVCKCKFDGKKCNSNKKWNNNKCRCKCKNIYMKEIILETCYKKL